MTKNTTRRGLALGAAFALLSTGLVAAPASAAGEISLAVNGGTGTSTILGESFSLKATVGSLVPDSSNGEVTFLVANATGATLTYRADAGLHR
jgi:gentisate 1,2-dioxygenase